MEINGQLYYIYIRHCLQNLDMMNFSMTGIQSKDRYLFYYFVRLEGFFLRQSVISEYLKLLIQRITFPGT